jgi:hypothetical protein
VVLLQGFQKGNGIKDCEEKGSEQFWQKRVFCSKEKHKKMRKTDRISLLLGSVKCFSISFSIKTL